MSVGDVSEATLVATDMPDRDKLKPSIASAPGMANVMASTGLAVTGSGIATLITVAVAGLFAVRLFAVAGIAISADMLGGDRRAVGVAVICGGDKSCASMGDVDAENPDALPTALNNMAFSASVAAVAERAVKVAIFTADGVTDSITGSANVALVAASLFSAVVS